MTKKSTLFLQIDDPAYTIEEALQQIAKPYPKGIYIKGNETPSLTPNNYYYKIDRIGRNKIKEHEVKTITDIVGNIYNEDGEIVIRDYISLNKEKYLFTSPTVPAYGRMVVRAGIRDYLDYLQIFKKCIHDDYFYTRKTFDEIVDPSYASDKNYYQYQSIVEDILNDYLFPSIKAFIGEKNHRTWDILLMDYERDTISIKNHGDYRIYQYMKEHGDEFNEHSTTK